MDRVVKPSFNGPTSTHPALAERWLAVSRLALYLALLPFGIKRVKRSNDRNAATIRIKLHRAGECRPIRWRWRHSTPQRMERL
jgi:hypothetical protein